MKKIILSFILCVTGILVKAQIITQATSPTMIVSQISGYSEVASYNTKAYSYTPSIPPTPPNPVDDDTTTEDEKRYRYGDKILTDITMADGNITTTSIGKVWTVRISIPNALNIGFTFEQFNLSSTAKMWIFNETRTTLKGEIKQEHFSVFRAIGISPLKGNSIIIYIIEPGNFGSFQSNILIHQLIAGFQEVDDVGDTGGQSARHITCIPSIQCEQSKMNIARSVARYTYDGHQCTGTLINNEGNNGRAFLLTAFHCIDNGGGLFGLPNGIIDPFEEAALGTAVFQFQFWRTQCNGSTNNTGIEFSGAILRAAWRNSDVVLLELIDPPGIGDRVNYAGWSRQTTSPSNNSSFIIHHPEGADMRITKTQNVGTFFWNSMYWKATYSSGVTRGGSSGAALYNEFGQIVGQLKAGASSCHFTDFGDRYGKFHYSWNGAGLQTWLSPNQGLQSTGLLNLTDIAINGPGTIACTTPAQFSTLPNLLDVTYQWTVTTGLQIVSGQGTSTVTISGFPNNNVGSGYLTLTLRSPTKGRTRIYTTTKQVFISNGSVLGTYNSPTNSAEPLAPFTRFNQVTNNTCISVATNMTIPAGSTVTWSGPANTSEIIWGQSGNNVNIYFSGLNQEIVLSLTVTNSCGTRNLNYRFTCTSTNSCGIAPLRVALSPNPSSSNMQVSLTDKANTNLKMDIFEIRIIDKSGTIKLRNTYGVGQKNINLNISTLTPDVYTILVFDKRTWTSEKFIKN